MSPPDPQHPADGERHGCAGCWPATPDAAWAARRGLDCFAVLVDESHFRVALLRCERCAQAFVSTFSEMIDWNGGDDPQFWTVLPVDDGEIAVLRAAAGPGSDPEAADGPAVERVLNQLAPQRRSLLRDYPSSGEPRLAWGTGAWVRPHD